MTFRTNLPSSSFQHVLDRAWGLASHGAYVVIAVTPNGIVFARRDSGVEFFVHAGVASW